MKLTTLALTLSVALSGHALASDKKEDKKPQTLSEMVEGQTEFSGIFNLSPSPLKSKSLGSPFI